jgi:hypothetical protein
VLAAAGLIAGVTSLGFPRATSNASVRHDDSPDATTVTTSTASTTSTTVATPTTDRSVAPVSGASRLCPIDWRQSAWHVKRLIRCAADHYDVSQRKALYVAWRESRYLPYAYNGAGPAAGVFQHLLRYWPDRADTYGFPDRSPFNARANILVTMRMVRDLGWSPWAL